MTQTAVPRPAPAAGEEPMESADPVATWQPLVVMRPDDSPDRVCLSDPLNGQRVTVPLDALLDVLTRPTGASPAGRQLAQVLRDRGWWPARPLDPTVMAALKRWWTRGWHPSLGYYLWSRHRRQIDLADGDGTVRRQVLRQYAVDEPLPPRIAVTGDPVGLPAPSPVPDTALGDVLMARRTVRGYAPVPVAAQTLGDVLYHGLSDVRAIRDLSVDDELNLLRSHGTPFEFYVANYRTEGLAPGIHHYDIRNHTLTPVDLGDHRPRMARILLGMRAPETAAWTLVIVGDFAQYQWRYRHERALRNLYMAAGRIAQRLIVVGHTYGFGSLPTPATHDLDLCDLLGVDAETHTPVYTLTMGPVPESKETSA
jgi:SagB-type dehydrogenase family enzyme